MKWAEHFFGGARECLQALLNGVLFPASRAYRISCILPYHRKIGSLLCRVTVQMSDSIVGLHVPAVEKALNFAGRFRGVILYGRDP